MIMNKILIALNLNSDEITAAIDKGYELKFVTNVTRNSTMGGTDIQYIFTYEKENNKEEVVARPVQEVSTDKRYGPRNKGK